MKKQIWQTAIFLALCAAILVFFLMAPESTTPRMPNDADHQGRSREYARCFTCHSPDTLPSDHLLADGSPPTGKQKCYFCHKLADTEK